MHPSTVARALAAVGLALVLFAVACSASSTTGQDPCTVYATSNECSAKLACQCEKSVGCFCVQPCDPTADAGSGTCPATTVCEPGSRPDMGSTGFFCFATDGGR